MSRLIAIQFPNRPDFDFFSNTNSLSNSDIIYLVNDISYENPTNLENIYLELTVHLEEVPGNPKNSEIENAFTVYI